MCWVWSVGVAFLVITGIPLQRCAAQTREFNLEERAEVAYHRKDYDQVIALYREAIRKGRASSWNLYLLGDRAVEQGDWEGGVRYSRAALELDPTNTRIYTALGWALTEMGRADEAIECLTRGIELDPRLSLNYNNLGYAYLKKQAYEHAIAAFRMAIDLEPADRLPYLNLADAYAAMSRFDEAIGTYQQLLDRGAQDAQVFYGLALAHEWAGHIDRAIAIYHEVLAHRPGTYFRVAAYLGLARMYRLQGKTQEMVMALDHAGAIGTGTIFAMVTILMASLVVSVLLMGPVAAILWIVAVVGRRLRLARAQQLELERCGVIKWGLVDVGLVLGVWPISSLAVSLMITWLSHGRSPLVFFAPFPVDQLSVLAWVQVLAQLIPCCLVVWLVCGKHRQGLSALGFASRGAGQVIRWALAAIAAMVFVSMIYAWLYRLLIGREPPPQDVSQFISLARTGLDQAVLVGLLVFLAPAFEECIFRGFVYPAVRKYVGAAGGMVCSALLFSLFHYSLAYAAWRMRSPCS